MLKIDVRRWRERLEVVEWAALPMELKDYIAAFKRVVPELADYIDKKAARLTPDAEGCIQLFITLERHADTGEQMAFEIAIAGRRAPVISPDHIHNQSPDADYGEEYGTLAGVIVDEDDSGIPFRHRRGDQPVRHGPETRHQPVIRDFWVGWFYQPAGSRLA